MKLKFLIFFAVIAFTLSSEAVVKSKKITMTSKNESIPIRWKKSQEWLKDQSLINLAWSNKVIAEGDWIIKSATVTKLCNIKSLEAQDVLLQLLTDKALVVRSASVDCLAQRMNPTVRESLWAAFKDPMNKRNSQSLWIREQILEVFLAQPNSSDLSKIKFIKDAESEIKISQLINQISAVR